jgi:hypothetical protein
MTIGIIGSGKIGNPSDGRSGKHRDCCECGRRGNSSSFPQIATALVAVLIARENAAALAYVNGSLGTLLGADLLNLDAVRGLGAPVASIGGAGDFRWYFPHWHHGCAARGLLELASRALRQ